MKSRQYLNKDSIKFNHCTHFVAFGCKGSSSLKYFEENTFNLNLDIETVTEESVVGISVNGKRKNRVPLNFEVLELLKAKKCAIVCDSFEHRNRPYNSGERELYNWLIENNYDEYFLSSSDKTLGSIFYHERN